MDTTRHHDISEVGARIIKDALKRAERGNFRTGAFYFGNWLTDVQQVIDPPAYDSVFAGIKEIDSDITRMFDVMQQHAPTYFFSPAADFGRS